MVVSVEEVALSLVREFLSRKGLKRTIVCMDEEHPRTESSINNRSELRQILQTEGLYRNNKARKSPLKTLLEIIVKYHIEGHKNDNLTFNHEPFQTFSRSTPTTHAATLTALTGIQESTREFCKTDANTRSVIQGVCPQETQRQAPTYQTGSRDTSEILKGKNDEPVALLQEKESIARRETAKTAVAESASKNRTHRIRHGMMGGPVANSNQDLYKKRRTRPQPLLGNEVVSPESWLSKGSASVTRPDQDAIECGPTGFAASSLIRGRQHSLSTERTLESKKSVERDVTKTRAESSPYQNNDHLLSSEMVLDDIDNDEELQELSKVSLQTSIPHHSYKSLPLDMDTAIELKEVLLGSSSRCFSAEWRNQGFTFSETPDLRYGIVQKKGGPCGVLASVQAWVLQKLLFDIPNHCNYALSLGLRPSNNARRRCLVLAAAEVLWRAGERKTATLAITSGKSHFIPSGYYKSEGLLEKITCFTMDNLKDLQLLLEQHIEQFEAGAFGCLLLTISAVLSRSIAKVREDMDVPTSTLIGAHGYCTQELVNLLLCGQAVSNVFDNHVELESGNGAVTLLKGIEGRCDIGFLSLFEYHNICKVGSNLKNPQFPIWVVCSESHFSILFGLQRELVTDQDNSQEFDLCYYDGLANQQEEIRLSVSFGSSEPFTKDKDPDLTPPLEQCIRTKWKDAVVDWNDTEPIL